MSCKACGHSTHVKGGRCLVLVTSNGVGQACTCPQFIPAVLIPEPDLEAPVHYDDPETYESLLGKYHDHLDRAARCDKPSKMEKWLKRAEKYRVRAEVKRLDAEDAEATPVGAILTDDVPVTMLLTHTVGGMLARLVDCGIFGRTSSEVGERFICERIKLLIDEGWFQVNDGEE